MQCGFIAAFFFAVFLVLSIEAVRAMIRDDDLIRVSQRRLMRMLNNLETGHRVRVTKELTNEQVEIILNNIPKVENDLICLQSESCALDWMKYYNLALEKIASKSSLLEFRFETNITDENGKANEEFAPVSNKFLALTKFTATRFLKHSLNWSPRLRRMFYLASLGIVLKDDNDAKLEQSLSNKLESIFAMAKVCDENQKNCMTLDPEITELMKSSRDYDKLLSVWKSWHDATGPKMRDTYTQVVAIQNRGAVYSNYKDLSQRWMEDYEVDDFEKLMDDLFDQIKPLYDQLHAYARRKLTEQYGSKYPKNHDPKLIPAHLLGNMWAQTWENVYDLLAPFPNTNQINLTQILESKKYTPNRIFKESEKFFKSIGLFSMTPTFWAYSLIEKPSDRQVLCHASACDFYNDYDFRIKMCTSVNEEDFYTVHHEMGHVEYFMAYSHQPPIFKNGANSAFHEAIGDTISLSVMTPKHFAAIGVIDENYMTYKQDINFLMGIALKKIAFLPFGYLMDKWRWDVFRGLIDNSNYNQKWWEMRKKFQGIEPPITRSEKDFDPASKYHVPSFVPYSRYFISHFLQFHFYQALCSHAGHTGPLHKCDFYESQEAGENLKNMLKLGNSKHWKIALRVLTGDSEMSAKPVLDYFKPLIDWLQKENAKYPEDVPGF